MGLCRLKAADSVSDTDQQSVRDTAPAKSAPCQGEGIQSVGDSAEMKSETDQIDPEENPDQEETSTMQFGMMQM